MATTHILSIVDGKLVLKSGNVTVATIHNLKDLQRVCTAKKYQPLMCSSSLDFPDEYTTDPTVIALCKYVRG